MRKQCWIVFFFPLVKAMQLVLGKPFIWENLLHCHVHHCVEEWSMVFCPCCVYIPYSSVLRGSEHVLLCESHLRWKEAALEAKLLPSVLILLIKAQMFWWTSVGQKVKSGGTFNLPCLISLTKVEQLFPFCSNPSEGRKRECEPLPPWDLQEYWGIC